MTTFYVLTNVRDNTYSSHLIRDDAFVNLHHFFEIRPEWYNRSTFKCTFGGNMGAGANNLVVVYFKDATPVDAIHMVALKKASANVKKAMKCVHREKRLRGGGVKKIETSCKKTSNYKKGMVGAAAVVGTVGLAALGRHLYLKNKTNTLDTGSQILQITTEEQKKLAAQQKFDKDCFANVKKLIGHANTQNKEDISLKIRQDCTPKANTIDLVKGPPIGKGGHGFVYNVQDHNEYVIKEQQKGLCYTFINEIKCLEILQNLDKEEIVPKIYDAYVCIPESKTLENIENTEVTYGYVMEKMDKTLTLYLQNYVNTDDDDEEQGKLSQDDLEKLCDRIILICTILDNFGILHRDMIFDNFMFDKNKTLKIIDFGLAYNKMTHRQGGHESLQTYLDPFSDETEWNTRKNICFFVNLHNGQLNNSNTKYMRKLYQIIGFIEQKCRSELEECFSQ